jgi:DNA (cytosine-5)-methyltransferase 1
MNNKFKYVSLFSGVGGFEQALDKLGGKCVLASEIDKFASRAYATLYGDEVLHGDVTQIDAKDVPDHDLLVGGFPCQSFSVAGQRGGFEDARGTLFFEVARIASEKQPSVLLLENVKGLVGHDKGKTLDTIVKTLNEIGYRVDFNVLNSKYFGVPQNRERIFIVAVREDLTKNEPWNNTKGTTAVPKGKRRISGYEDVKTFNFNWPEQDEVTTRLRDILEPEVDEKYYLSEDKTAKLVKQLNDGLAIKEATSKGYAVATEGDAVNFQFPDSTTRRGRVGNQIANTLEASSINQGVVVKGADPQMIGHVDIKGHDSVKRVYSPSGVSPTLTTMGGGHREPKIAEEVVGEVRPVLTPDRLNKRQNGRRFKDNDEEMFTLTSQDRHGIALGYGDVLQRSQSGVSQKDIYGTLRAGASRTDFGVVDEEYPKTYRIRKLTPLECFRLQGFPDAVHKTLVDADISDSQRYKMAGNAVTVNVIESLGRRILTYLDEA